MTEHRDRVAELLADWRAQYPEALAPTSELAKRIIVLAADLDEASRRILPDFDLTVAEFQILVALRRSPPPHRLKPNELSSSLLMSSGGTSNVTNELVGRRLVEREDDPDDRRSSWVRLTEEGARLAERAVRASTAAHSDVFAGAADEDVRVATDALRRLSAAVEAPRQPTPPPARATRPQSVT
ncbi:DNA-binding MarR family transcriptional regulator [Haloactinopolyspora alba]|uniref:DNA-binding MarR family transcriptional regulator n=1 Tax=Haloactinopolyspora alba TaxID=648780 RepID=A0A2P8E505_9ACTN|nr:MarR family transcriptional regulator [Haloactinopolyspora alba]PSL04541.1 DNA-binding MarR family transcriptional regulator [Haloactinopolyspora alba]